MEASVRADLIGAAYDALNNGDTSPFRALFAADAQWLGIPGTGFEGETPI